MATVIQIKRSPNVAAPQTSDLVLGELAYSYDKSNDGAGAKLYIEALNNSDSQVIHTIGGKYYTDAVDGATSNNTANKIVKRDASGNFSANIITADVFGNANTATRLATTRYINLSGDVSGSAAFDGSGNANITVTTQGITANSITTFTNKTFDVSVGSNNKFSIQGNEINSYSGSGSVALLQNSPTVFVLNIGDSNLNVDGGTGNFYWSGQSGVAQSGNYKAGIYSSTPNSPDSLFTFGTNSANTMSVSVEGSLFVGTSLPSNNGGLNTSYDGWLVVQSGGKFGGTINTLGALQFDDAQTGKVIFADGTEQNTAFKTSVLTTANVSEVTNLYFTNARARAAITSGNTILYNSATGNITLSPSGVTATTYGSTTQVPVITVDEYGRITSAANASLVATAFGTISVAGQSDVIADQANDSLTLVGANISITTNATTDTITLTNDGVTSVVAGTGISVSGATGAVTINNTGVTQLTGTANQISVSAGTGSVTLSLPSSVTTPGDLTVTGNLVVNGTAITVNTVNMTVNDPLVRFGDENPGDGLDIGFFGAYTSGGTKFAGLFRDASDSGRFKLFTDLTSDPTTNVINTASYTAAALEIGDLYAGTINATIDGGTY